MIEHDDKCWLGTVLERQFNGKPVKPVVFKSYLVQPAHMEDCQFWAISYSQESGQLKAKKNKKKTFLCCLELLTKQIFSA